jgi:probable rRNA maturation factor
MSHTNSLQVEVDIQNAFWELAHSGLGNLIEETGAIAPMEPPVGAQTWQQWLRQWLETLGPNLSPIQAYELSVRFTTDVEIQHLNAQYRHIDQPTDVLAFAALEVNMPQIEEIDQFQPLYLGDIVISVETAQRQADQQEHTLNIELAWLVSHGLLHLLGWDHPDEDQLNQMLSQQEALLKIIGLPL